jgi:hypothetical protein
VVNIIAYFIFDLGLFPCQKQIKMSNSAIQPVNVQDWTGADFPIPTTFQKEGPERIVVEELTEEPVSDVE